MARNKTIGDDDSNSYGDSAADDLELFESWRPYLRKMGDPEKINHFELNTLLQQKGGPLAMMVLMRTMLSSKDEKIRVYAAKEVADRGGFKPVERVQSVNVNLMGAKEIDALLRSKLNDFGFNVRENELGREETVIAIGVGEGGGGEGKED